MSFLSRAFDPTKRELKRHDRVVAEINALEDEMRELSDDQLAAKTAEFREYLGYSGTDESHGQSAKASLEDSEMSEAEAELEAELAAAEQRLDEILPEAFAVVREMSRRVLGMRHYDVQLIGGIVLHQGKIAEMRTGEGKTLVATLPLYLNALLGRGAHLVTVNDYLARRDAGWNAALFHRLGMTVGVITPEQSHIYDPDYLDESHPDPRLQHLRPCTRREAYAADITYATNNELGFDYLRDNMARRLQDCVQRRLHYAIVDEVDSILVDEARTPLIISGQGAEAVDLYYTYAQVVPSLVAEDDYVVDEESRSVALTDEGAAKIERKMGFDNLYGPDHVVDAHQVNKALLAHALYKRDKDYIVRNGEVVIVDEFTGRTMPGRRWSDGLHQAIEAKEGVRVQQENRTLATITFQNFFRLYHKLAGMTGTALTEAEEFDKIYSLDVVPIPTNRPNIRADQPDFIFRTEAAKFEAVVDEIVERHKTGQPVLVGTTSIEKSERLSRLLEKRGIEHEVLNAKFHEREAEIVESAGQMNAVTIATNMAGRGTDIVLGDGVADLGGLCIIGTERHESRRIDNQLRGRAGRQGDPGETRFFLSFEDDVMRIFGGERVQGMMERLLDDDQRLESRMVTKTVEGAQARVEGANFDTRRSLVDYDDVMNRQREIVYGERRKILEGTDTRDNLMHMIETVVDRQVAEFCSGGQREWDLEGLWKRVRELAPLPPLEEVNLESLGSTAPDVAEALTGELVAHYEEIEAANDPDMIRSLEQDFMLTVIDTRWVEYLTHMTQLREEIQFHHVGQMDPRVEYKQAAFEAFQELVSDIELMIVSQILGRMDEVIAQIKQQAAEKAAAAEAPEVAPAAVAAAAPPSPRADKPGSGRAAPAMTPPAARPAAAAASGALDRATGRSRQMAMLGGPQVTNVVESGGGRQVAAAAPAKGGAATASSPRKVGRNEPCPCGSGKKYKYCHGR